MKHAIKISLLLFLCLPLIVLSQKEGCTDPDASNFDPQAELNDGSCKFKVKPLRPRIAISNLPLLINETSGLIYWDGYFWTHNDSGGENAIYKIDSLTGYILQTITLKDAVNIDWEDIAQDEKYVYIGDFGNNLGSRKDLRIYKISKKDIHENADTIVNIEVINFAYGDQTDFSERNLANDHDCEALICYGDSLYLFSKNWSNLDCRLYALPKQPGSYYIYPIDDFNTDGLITGATIDIETKILTLCGYKNYRPFLWVLDTYWRNDFFGGNKRKFSLPDLLAVQTEGITYGNNGKYFLSAEKTKINNARIYRYSLSNIREQ